jgi:hypothetical protein
VACVDVPSGVGVAGAGRGPLDVAEPKLSSPSSDHINCGLNGDTSGGGEALDRTCSMAGRSPALTEVGQDFSGKRGTDDGGGAEMAVVSAV